MNFLRQLLELFDRRERWQLAGLLTCMLLMAVLQTTGVASIMPFMQVVSDPELVQRNHWLAEVYERLGFTSTDQFLLFLGVGVLGLMILSNGFSAFTSWLMFRFAAGRRHQLSMRLLARYLARPYAFYLNRNTADLNTNILAEVQTVINNLVVASLRFVARGLVALLIIVMLMIIDPVLALVVGSVLGGVYGIIYGVFRRRQRQIGRIRVAQNQRRFQVTAEALTGIKDVKVLAREDSFLTRFKQPSWEFSKATASNQIVSNLPHYALETIAFGGILLIVLYSLRVSGNMEQILPIVSLYAFAGYRLMPALNSMFSAGVQVRFNRAALDDVHADLIGEDGERPDEALRKVSKQWSKGAPMPLRKSLALRDVSFSYPGASGPSLAGVTLTIPHRQVIGFVGQTGAGKTTLVDLILGLLEPTRGVIEVDGEPLVTEARLRSWRRSCGYVPQEIFLTDDSIRANIALGIPEGAIDETAVVRAACGAQIDEFIRSLPQGYDTMVGERGLRLSGGQRQRIGIARALYHDPQVLVMDEATSSLDGVTEAAVIEMIQKLGRKKTLIVIAHRLSTVRMCDQIHLLQEGKVTASGTYDELMQTNAHFRDMAGLQVEEGTGSHSIIEGA